MTIMDYFKEKPERATIYLIKRGCGHVSEFETEEGKTIEESIEDYLCYVGLCVFCPARPCDDVCEDRLKKWLNLPADELGKWTYGEYANSIDDLDQEDREAVKKILKDATNDAVHHPNHYQIADGVEVIDVIKKVLTRSNFTGFQGYCLGNVIKYVLRADLKNGREDYEKASVYLEWLIQSMEGAK